MQPHCRRNRQRHPESLESRWLFAADIINTAEIRTLGAEAAHVQPFFCAASPQQVQAPIGPSPFLSDHNLDGVFSSEDLVGIYRAANPADPLGTNDPQSPDRIRDLIESMQLLGYETGETVEEVLACSAGSSTGTWNGNQVRESVEYQSDGITLRRVVTDFGDPASPRYRLVQRYNVAGALQSISAEIYRDDSGTIYARSQTEYSATGQQIRQSTAMLDEAGQRRRLTATTLLGSGNDKSHSVDVQSFDKSETLTSRETHYFDRDSRRYGVHVYSIQRGIAVSVISLAYDVNGDLVQTGSVEVPRESDVRFPSGYSPTSYLLQVQDAFDSTRDRLKEKYSGILKMHALPAQRKVNELLQQANITGSDATRYRHLQNYFDIVSDLAATSQTGDVSTIFSVYFNYVDAATGNWTPWFQALAKTQNLRLPLPPLRLPVAINNLSPDKVTAAASTLWELMGANPHQYFNERYGITDDYIRDLQVGMRKAMANIKALEYRSAGGPPIMDWTVAEDNSSWRSLGVQEIVPLTSWHFFPLVNGEYITDEPNEAIVKQRVEEGLLNENVFYVINIEVWDVEEPGNLTAQNLAKLKKAADLVHKYNPNLLIGHYRMLPGRDPMATYEGPSSERFQQWQHFNDIVAAALIDSVDIVFPSLYTLHLGVEDQTSEERWKVFATESIRDAKRIADGKPVIPFIMLYYHRNGLDPVTRRPLNPKALEWIEPEFVLYQLLTANSISDGIVIYNDRFMSPTSENAAQVTAAIRLFFQWRNSNAESSLRAKYDRLLATYHDDLLTKLETEKQLRYAQFNRAEALLRGDSGAVAKYDAQITAYQGQLSTAIDLWELLQR